MLPLIHCGYGLGQDAIASDTPDIAIERRMARLAWDCATGIIAAMAGGKSAIIGSAKNWTLSAQSSGLANRSRGRPKLKIPNGLGSELVFGAPQTHLIDEGATSPRT